MQSDKAMIDTWRQSSTAERIGLVGFLLFLALVLVSGGASRADVLGQGLVRIASILMIGWAILQLSAEGWSAIKTPALFLIALGLVIAVQLIPLPPGLWQALPGREVYVEALAAAGIAPHWRPLSLTPDLTLNSLLAVLAPLAAVLGMGLVHRNWSWLVPVLLIGIGVSALIGILQISAGSPYFYRITNLGSAVGVFANRNHSALFIALAFPLLAGWAYASNRAKQSSEVRLWVALCCAAAIFPLLLVTGSRGGLILGVAGALLAAAIAAGPIRSRRKGGQRPGGRKRLLIFGLPLALGAAAVLLFIGFARDEALRRMFLDGGGAVRGEFLPLYLQMIADFFPAGSGFGSFDPVFRAYEPFWALDNFYLNHAHNDPVELLIEGGLAALALLVAFLAWVAVRSFAAWRRPLSGSKQLLARVGTALVAMVLVGSLVDYPLRTPIVAVVFAIACCLVAGAPRKDKAVP